MQAMDADRPSVVKTPDGFIAIRASEFGGCLRCLVGALIGVPPSEAPPWLKQAWERGKAAEPLIEAYLKSTGARVLDSQKAITLPLAEKTLVTGTCDWLLHLSVLEEKVLCEGKNLSDDNWQIVDEAGLEGLGILGRRYLWQVSSYMHGSKLPLILAYRNHRTKVTKMLAFEEPPVSLDEMRARAAELVRYGQNEEYPECDGECSPGSQYWHIHDEIEVVVQASAAQAPLVQQYVELDERIKELEQEKAKLRHELIEQVGDGKVRAGWAEINLLRTKSKRTDLKKMRQENGPDFMERYEYETWSTRLVPRRLGGKGAASAVDG